MCSFVSFPGCTYQAGKEISAKSISAEHQKIQAMMVTLSFLQEQNALKSKGVIKAWYSVSIGPNTFMPFYHLKKLQDTAKYSEANVAILVSPDNLDDVDMAMVTEVLEFKNRQTRCSTKAFMWSEHGKWSLFTYFWKSSGLPKEYYRLAKEWGID